MSSIDNIIGNDKLAADGYPVPSMTNSLCILSPIKARESTFFKLGESALRKFRLMDEEDHAVTYVAQLVIHITGSEEAIQPSLIPLYPTIDQAFSYSLNINLAPNSQLFEAILPHLSLHNNDCVQADISVYELIAVTRSLTESIYVSATAEDTSVSKAGTPSKRSSSAFLEVPKSPLASTMSRFSSSSTLVSTASSSSASQSSAASSADYDSPSKVRNWFCTQKDSSSLLIRRFSKHIKRARSLSPSALVTSFGRSSSRNAEAASVPTKVKVVELDMDRWHVNAGSAESAASATLPLPGSWASSISLGSEMSESVAEEDKGVKAAVACATQVLGTVAMK